MIFSTLWESAQRGELLLVQGGMARYHVRRDGQLTLHEIISTERGAGREMLERLKVVDGATSILARCPAELAANSWYAKRGFALEGTETTRSGRILNVWRLPL